MSKQILLVEDNPDDELLTLRALRMHDVQHEVVVVRDGQAALDWLFGTGPYAGRDATALPALILLDLKMPKVDGLEVLRRVRADSRTRRATVVVFTSSTEERDVLQCYDLGANGYVRKPVNFTEFSASVKGLGSYWLSLNAPPPG